MKKQQAEGPTRHSIEQLLKELSASIPHRCDKTDEIEKLDKEIDALETKLLQNAALRKLRDKRAKLEKANEFRINAMRVDIRELRMLFLAKGLSPAVIVRASMLAEKYKRGL